VAAAIALVPLAVHCSELPAVLFLSLLWARVSDVGVATQGLPSVAVPCGIGLLCLSLGRRILAGERITVTTFRGLFGFLPYLTVVGLSAVWATDPDRAVTTAIDLGKDLLIFWVLVELIADSRILKACGLALVLTAGVLSLLSVSQYTTGTFMSNYGGFATASVRQIVNNINLYRIGGPIGDPNFYALILLVTVPLGLALLRTSLHTLMRAALACSVVLTIGTVLLTYSRGGTLVLALGCLAWLVRCRIRAPLLAALVAALPVVFVLLPISVWERIGTVLRPFEDTGEIGQVVDTSVELRLGAQRVALEMFLDSPLLGVGAGNYPLLYPDYSRNLGVVAVASEFYPHNLYLQVAGETGTLGLLTFLPAVVGPLVGLELVRRRAHRLPVDQPTEWLELTFGIEVAMACYLAASVMLHGSYPRYLWMLLALVVAAHHVAPLSLRRQ
jgi:putative inorganic carbon (hco3(-)) transporter